MAVDSQGERRPLPVPLGQGSTRPLTYSPWDDVGERYPDWVIRHEPLRGLPELMCWRRRVILIEHDRTVTERRCDLAHALGHLDLAHGGDTFNRHHEEAARRHAARLLVDLQKLGDALAWSSDSAEVADLLWVDEETLRLRLKHLHPSERAYLRQRLALLA